MPDDSPSSESYLLCYAHLLLPSDESARFAITDQKERIMKTNGRSIAKTRNGRCVNGWGIPQTERQSSDNVAYNHHRRDNHLEEAAAAFCAEVINWGEPAVCAGSCSRQPARSRFGADKSMQPHVRHRRRSPTAVGQQSTTKRM